MINRKWLDRSRFLDNYHTFAKGGGSSSTTTTQKADPWSGQQPYLTSGFQSAQGLYNQGPQQYYPDSTVAPLSDTSNQAISSTADRATNGSPVNAAAQAESQKTLGGGYLGNSNPYLSQLSAANNNLSSTIDGGYLNHTNPFAQQLGRYHGNLGPNSTANNNLASTINGDYLDPTKNTALSAIVNRNAGDISANVNSQFGAAGRTGSGINQQVLERSLGDNANQLYGAQYDNERNRMLSADSQYANNVGQSDALRSNNLAQAGGLSSADYNAERNRMLSADSQFSNNIAQAGNQYSTDYNAERSRMGQDLALAPQTSGTDYTDLAHLAAAGGAQDAQTQAQLSDQVNRYNYNQSAPWSNLQNYIAAIQGNYGGSTTQTGKAPGGNPIAGILGGGLAGSQIGGGISNSSGGNYGGWGSLIGAGLGAFSS